MLKVRRANERGRSEIGWLDSRHTFSFADYYDGRYMGFRALRVINEDRVAPGAGFGTHPHRDMEIVSYVLSGALEHKDSLGTGSVIHAGEVQRMTAGTGVLHSEFNASRSEPVHFLQIWIVPEARALEPTYEQLPMPLEDGRFRLVASRDGRDASLTIHQDVAIYAARLIQASQAHLDLAEGRHAWVQVVRGEVDLDGTSLGEGDGAAVSDARTLTFAARRPSELLVFDLA